VKKLKLRIGVKLLMKNQPSNNLERWDLNLGSLAPKSLTNTIFLPVNLWIVR
jgi:hypothetical protein